MERGNHESLKSKSEAAGFARSNAFLRDVLFHLGLIWGRFVPLLGGAREAASEKAMQKEIVSLKSSQGVARAREPFRRLLIILPLAVVRHACRHALMCSGAAEPFFMLWP